MFLKGYRSHYPTLLEDLACETSSALTAGRSSLRMYRRGTGVILKRHRMRSAMTECGQYPSSASLGQRRFYSPETRAGANFRIAHNPESSGKPSMSLNKVEGLDGPRSIFIDGASFQEWLLPVAFDTSDAISARWSLSHWPVMTINSLKLLLPERT